MSPYEIEIDKSAIEALIKLIKEQPAPLSWDLVIARDSLMVALNPELDADLWGDDNDRD
jgi:hypothetical protein